MTVSVVSCCSHFTKRVENRNDMCPIMSPRAMLSPVMKTLWNRESHHRFLYLVRGANLC